MTPAATTSDVETIVIGAGVVGLATARSAALAGEEVVVLERNGAIGSETSSRNSEVIHAGLYYPAGSMKARACVEGKAMLYRYCADHGVGHARLGKLVVATDEGERERLDAIAACARANGVDDVAVLDRAETLAREPALSATGALHSPSTGIVDSHGLMLALQGELEDAGGSVATHAPVERIEPATGGLRVTTGGPDAMTLTARRVIVAAGLGTTDILPDAVVRPDGARWTTGYAKGTYFRLAGRAPFETLIYPVPIVGGLGVHLTLDLAGQARFGPDVEWVETIDYATDLRRGDGFAAAIRRYWPGLPDGALTPDYTGIRPKVGGRASPSEDFRILRTESHGIEGLTVALGIESPGLTSSLWLGERLAA